MGEGGERERGGRKMETTVLEQQFYKKKLVHILQLSTPKFTFPNNPLSVSPGMISLRILTKNISDKLKLLRWIF